MYPSIFIVFDLYQEFWRSSNKNQAQTLAGFSGLQVPHGESSADFKMCERLSQYGNEAKTNRTILLKFRT